MGKEAHKAYSHLNIIFLTFIIHFFIVRYVKTHVVVFEFGKAQLHPTDVLNLNNRRKDAKAKILEGRVVKKVDRR